MPQRFELRLVGEPATQPPGADAGNDENLPADPVEMRDVQLAHDTLAPPHEQAAVRDAHAVRDLLYGHGEQELELPALSELTAAATALARRHRDKALLQLPGEPIEVALVRRGPKVFVSAYDTGSVPRVRLLDRPVNTEALLNSCARATLAAARSESDPTARQIALRLAERATQTVVEPSSALTPEHVVQGPGSAPKSPIAFRWEATLYPGQDDAGRVARADVHALLFPGTLWAWVRGRRLLLRRGPIVLVAQRMVAAVQAMVDAEHAGREPSFRLRSDEFSIGIRRGADGEGYELTLGGPEAEIRATALSANEIGRPVLRLASDLLRVLVRTDRQQRKNLRVTALRDQVKSLRRALKELEQIRGFTNTDADRLRYTASLAPTPAPTTTGAVTPPKGIRFEERWRVALDGLDAGGVFFCGDRLVFASPRHTLAVDRENGEVLWAREGASAAYMVGRTLLRVRAEGGLELCSVDDGEPYATSPLHPRPSARYQLGLDTERRLVRGVPGPNGTASTMALVAEDAENLAGLDLRTGEPRWRFCGRGTKLHASPAGRMVIVSAGTALHGIDATSGDDLWRFGSRGRLTAPAAICLDVACIVSEGATSEVLGVDLFSGEVRWQVPMPARASGAPFAAGGRVLIPLRGKRLLAIDAQSGQRLWEVRDPTVGADAYEYGFELEGDFGMGGDAFEDLRSFQSLGVETSAGASLVVDDLLVTNGPGGRVAGLDLRTGERAWGAQLGDPADEIPRFLEPVLRGGGLFVPAGDIWLVRPRDGQVLGRIESELVPDRFRVDERGWVFLAEESGHLAAYAPARQLRVIEGGR